MLAKNIYKFLSSRYERNFIKIKNEMYIPLKNISSKSYDYSEAMIILLRFPKTRNMKQTLLKCNTHYFLRQMNTTGRQMERC